MIRVSYATPGWMGFRTSTVSRGWCFSSAVLAVSLACAVARAGEPPAPVTLGQWLRTAVDARGRNCTPHAQREDGKRVYVACGAAGLWEVDVSLAPVIVRVIDLHG